MDFQQIEKSDIDAFVAGHEFNEVGDKDWFRLAPHRDLYRQDPFPFLGRKFTVAQVAVIVVGLETMFRARPRKTGPEIRPVKKALNSEAAWKIQETYEDRPHGWIQWKGTTVCMDVYCDCGHHLHIDAQFAYHVKCPKCARVYMCNGHVELIEIEQEPQHNVITPELDDD